METAILTAIQALGEQSRRLLPDALSPLAGLAQRIAQWLCGPILDKGGRFPWWGLLSGLILAAAVYALDRRRANGGFLRFCFPPEIYRSASTWMDLKLSFFNYVLFGGGALNLTWRINAALLAAWITTALAAWFGPSAHPAAWGPLSILLFAIASSLVNDLGYFLFHWASHVCPPLWAIHKLHHSAECMTPLTAARVHPLERPILGPFRAVTSGALMGPIYYLYGGETSFPTILGIDLMTAFAFAIGHLLQHSHIWLYFGPVLGRIVVSPAQHQIHHSCLPQHLDKNFAEHWAIWDTIFGTIYLPKGREPLKFGLAGYDRQPHDTVLKSWFVPVAEAGMATVHLGWRCLPGWGLGRWNRRVVAPDPTRALPLDPTRVSAPGPRSVGG